ncbi:uncharacterized protein [Typha angustifolia]|uniref:uncharacterized protein isoform X2 n=1 Tax=Typha angustifolia TaxID=59011 RepID=UPI003C2E6118
MVGDFELSMRPHPSLPQKEDRSIEEDGESEIDANGDTEKEMGFKPLEHPLEPMDEDRPMKCPMLNCFPLTDKGEWKDTFTESLWKGVEFTAESNEMEDGRRSLQATHKRHHHISRDPPHMTSLKRPQYNFFQVFQQCKEYGA